MPCPGTKPATLACALMGNRTNNALLCGTMPSQLSHASQGGTLLFCVFMASCFIFEAEEETLEHNSVTLKKNYRGYNEPDNYSTDWNLIMEKVRFISFFSLKLLYFYFQREGKGGKKRGRETSVCGCLSCPPHWASGLQPRHVP